MYCPIISPASSLELNAVEVVAGVSDWEELGRRLCINHVKISQLGEDGGDTEHCREEVVLEWLKEDKTASWQKLCRALEQMGREAEVQNIKEHYYHVSDHSLESQSSEGMDFVTHCIILVQAELYLRHFFMYLHAIFTSSYTHN